MHFTWWRHPAVWSVLIHLGLILLLGPGHHDEHHTVQWFDGTLEIGEAGDGHSERLHFHREPKKSETLEPSLDAEKAHAPNSGDSSGNEPIEVLEAGGPGVGGTPLNEQQRYLLGLMQRLDSVKRYPRESLLKEEEGKVTLTLVIGTDGTLESYSITKPSHFLALNRATLAAAAQLKKLPPLPPEWTRSIRVPVTISYQIER